jgi:hypothetical protein
LLSLPDAGHRGCRLAGESLWWILFERWCRAVVALQKKAKEFTMFLIDLLTFATSLVVPAWFLVIVLAACAAMLWGHFRARKNYQEDLAIQKIVLQCNQDARAKEAKEAETRRQAHKNTISALQARLRKLEYVVRGTDEASEQEYRDICEEQDEEYEMPEPLQDAVEFALEITFLRKVLSAIYCDLSEERISDLDLEFYQKWVTSLQSQITSWDERRRAISRLENLKARLLLLEQILQRAHDVETRSSSYSSIPVQSHQDLFNLVVVLRDWLERKLTSKTADLVKEAAQFTLEVEDLERQHEALDGALTVSYETTSSILKQVALGAWDFVIAYAFETSPAFLVPYYQESLHREENEFAQAMAFLAERGECGQCKAVEHMSIAIKHWGFWRALHVVMYEKQSVKEAYDEFLLDVEAKIPSCLEELKRVMDDPFALDEEFASMPKLFS